MRTHSNRARNTTLAALTLIFSLGISAIAEARVPYPAEIPRIRDIAVQLEVDTNEAYYYARDNADYSDPEEDEALGELLQLKHATFNLAEAIASQPIQYWDDHFQAVSGALVQLQDSYYYLEAYSELRPVFDAIFANIEALRYYFVDTYYYAPNPGFFVLVVRPAPVYRYWYPYWRYQGHYHFGCLHARHFRNPWERHPHYRAPLHRYDHRFTPRNLIEFHIHWRDRARDQRHHYRHDHRRNERHDWQNFRRQNGQQRPALRDQRGQGRQQQPQRQAQPPREHKPDPKPQAQPPRERRPEPQVQPKHQPREQRQGGGNEVGQRQGGGQQRQEIRNQGGGQQRQGGGGGQQRQGGGGGQQHGQRGQRGDKEKR